MVSDAKPRRYPRVDPFPGDVLRQHQPFSGTTNLITVVEMKRDPEDRARIVVFDITSEGFPPGGKHRVEHDIEQWRIMCAEPDYQVVEGHNQLSEDDPR